MELIYAYVEKFSELIEEQEFFWRKYRKYIIDNRQKWCWKINYITAIGDENG